MAGHSHWANVKRKKEKAAKKRSIVFTRASKQIISAVREGGPNPESNSALRAAIEYAKSVNMPKENIERVIKKASGALREGSLKQIIYEAYGPSNIPLLIKVVSDNLNRTVGELRNILSEFGGRLADKGSVLWQFKEVGLIKVVLNLLDNGQEGRGVVQKEQTAKNNNTEELEELALELMEFFGVKDINISNDAIEVIVDKKEVSDIASRIEEKFKGRAKVVYAGRYFLPTQPFDKSKLDKDRLQDFVDTLEDLNEVENIWLA